MTLPFKMKMSILCIAVLGVLCTEGYGRSSIKTSTHLLLSGHDPIPDGDFPKILTIVIQNSSIRELPPDIFRGFYNVEQITIISSNLSVIRDGAFRNLSRLKRLIINGNRITKIHNNAFDGLASLEHLHLGSNHISSFAKEVLSPLYSLTSLHLPNNAIATLTADFLVGTGIREFNLEGNPLDLSDGPILASEYLENLNLQSCNLKNLSSKAFAFLPNVTNLDLARNSFPVLPAGLSKDNLRLNHLDYECNISARNAKVLCLLTIRGVELSCRGDNSNTPLDCTYYRNSGTTVSLVDDNLLKQKDNFSGSETNDDEGQEENKSDTTDSDSTVYVQESSTSDAGDQNVQSREVPKSHSAEDQNVLKIIAVAAGFVFISCLITAISVYVMLIYRRDRNVLVAEQVPFILRWMRNKRDANLFFEKRFEA